MADHQHEKDDQLAGAASGADEKQTPSEPSEFTFRSCAYLAASAVALFNTVGFLNAFGIFETYYSAHYLAQYSSFDISWIGSFSIFLFFCGGVPAGYLSDRFGPTLPITIGSFLQLLGIFMTSLCRQYYQFFLAQGVVLGLGFSLVVVPTTSVTPRYFQRNRGFAQGVTIAGSSLGGVLWPIILEQMLNSDHISFGWSLRIVGFIQMPLFAIAIYGVKRPKTPKAPASTPSEHTETETEASPVDAKRQAAQQRRKDMVKLRHPTYLFICAGLPIFYLGFFAPFFFVSDYALALGLNDSFSFYTISILNAASMFGRTLPGLIADRVGLYNILLLSMFASALVCFCWTAVQSEAGLIVWSLAYGFASGAVLSLQFACISVVATREIMGIAIGIVMLSIALTALFGTPIAGELVKSGYLDLSAFAGTVMLVGGLFVTAARLSRNRKLISKT